MQLIPHLHFKGNCREAFNFYVETLGGKIELAMTFGESPMAEQVPPAMRGQIIHIRASIGGQLLLGCDVPPDRYRAPQGFNVMLAFDRVTDGERVSNALARGGSIDMPFQQTFWAHRFGMCADRFGTAWMINCEKAA